MAAIRSVTDVMSAASTIQDALQFAGANEPAEELGKALLANWRTSTEALDATAKALIGARYAVSRSLDAPMLQLLDEAVAGARTLTDDPSQLSLWQRLTSYFRK
jgi:hypothetical protein